MKVPGLWSSFDSQAWAPDVHTVAILTEVLGSSRTNCDYTKEAQSWRLRASNDEDTGKPERENKHRIK